MSEPRFVHTRNALRLLGAVLLCWFVAGLLDDGAGIERANAQSTGAHSETLRPVDAVTSMTATLRHAEEVDTSDRTVNFAMLKETELKRKPPPIYPEKLSAMDGQVVTVRGFMAPYDSLTDMRNMMLMPTAVGCYFCTPPSPKEVVFVRRHDAEEQPFLPEPIEVTGTLKLWKKESTDPEHAMFLYILEDAKVRIIKS